MTPSDRLVWARRDPEIQRDDEDQPSIGRTRNRRSMTDAPGSAVAARIVGLETILART
jgi:hypothetical protein